MAEKDRKPIRYDGNFFRSISNEIRLVFRLMADSRVRWWLKGLPFLSLLYFLFPDIAPGPIDDALVIFIGVYTFIELCPPEIVEEHRQKMENTISGEWRDVTDEAADVVESKFLEAEQDQQEHEDNEN